MGSKTKLLVVSYVFPPVGEVGGHRVARFCRYLPEYGIEPVVVTVRTEHYRYRDESVRPPEGIRVERTGVLPTPVELYRRWKLGSVQAVSAPAAAAAASAAKKPGTIRRHLLTLLQIPDPYWGWYYPAVRAAEKLIQKESFAAMFSTAPPWTSHVVARHLKKKFAIPWLADFRDPWSTDHGDIPAWKHRLNVRMEASCVRLADRVLCNTGRLRQFFTELYKGKIPDKFITLPNGFEDPVVPPAPDHGEKPRRLFLHIGSLYAQRRVDTFCEAVSNLVKQGRLDPKQFRIVFLGDTHPSLLEDARRKAPLLLESECIQFQPRVSWREAQSMLWDADLLLLFQGDLRLEVPAKFFEYLPTGKPIFAVVQEGALSDLIASTDAGLWARPDDPVEIAERLMRVLERPPRSPAEVRRLWYETHHSRTLTGRLAKVIEEVTARRKP